MGKLATIASTLLLASSAAALDPIIVKGAKFFFNNGTQFYMKGVAYQQDTSAQGGESLTGTYHDPLADTTACRRDIPLLKALGTNTIRTYAIDPTLDHSVCMGLLQDAGIYVISDLGEPRLSINRDNPNWNIALFNRYKAVIDELGKYNNVIGFLAGNEVANSKSNTGASAFVKAAVRDSKKYIASKGGRWMGVGNAANDDGDIRADMAHYFNCGSTAEGIDFFGYNIYSWCGSDSSFTKSGYDKQVDFFRNYSVPVFFAEYGCNTVGGAEGRTFDDTTALYSSQMTGVFSGGIVYMYFQEANDYGLVKVSNGAAQTMVNYNALKTKVLAATPASTAMSAYSPTNSPASCPAVSSNWQVSSNALPPTPDSQTCECMYNSLACVPKSSVTTDGYANMFGFICGKSASLCSGINGNPATGVYGAYVMCNDTQKLGYVMNEYYKSQKSAASSCDFSGNGTVKAAAAASSCNAVLSSASAANSVAATATAAAPASTSTNAARGLYRMDKVSTLGEFAIGGYMLVAMGVGAGMLLL